MPRSSRTTENVKATDEFLLGLDSFSFAGFTSQYPEWDSDITLKRRPLT